MGLKPKFAKDEESIVLSKSPFCQVGFEAYHIIIDGKKIGGNAQKELKIVFFSMAAIPLFTKEDNEVFGSSLQDFGINLNFEEAKDGLIKAFKEVFEVEIFEDSLNEEEKNILEKIEEEK